MTDPQAENSAAINPLERNIDLVAKLGSEILSDHIERERMLEHAKTLGSMSTENVQAMRKRSQKLIDGYEELLPVAQQVVRAEVVTEQIDKSFIEDLLIGIADKGQTDAFFEEEVPSLLAQLSQRVKLAQIEAASQTKASAEISQGRSISVVQGLDTTKFNLALPLKKQTKEKLTVGGLILDAPLLDEDYAAISQLMRENLEGSALEQLQNYETAVRDYMRERARTGVSSDELMRRLQLAGVGVIRAVSDYYASHVAVYSVYSAVMREFPELSDVESPQPFGGRY